jgi:hypothetical protein
MNVTLVFVDSTVIRAVGYDGTNLYVQFHTSERIYNHPGVPYSVYAELMNASSLGNYYNRHIRGRYR